MKKTSILLIFIALGVLLIGAPDSSAYLEYADTGFGGCDNCHGAYVDNRSYISLVDGADWNSDLMDVHILMTGEDCNSCHLPGQNFPVFTNRSGSGSGFDPIGCVGCHGRAEDRGTEFDCVNSNNPLPPCGDGAGLRQHHFNASPDFAGQFCLNCHVDTDPANFTPVDEDVKPPYYTPDPDPNHPNKPTDPCSPNGEENFAGTSIGLDNDGDLIYDNSDCLASNNLPGDCNGDGIVDAGDIPAVALEIFDGDGSLPADTPGGTFPGDPAGSDANEDGTVDAGDISCTVLIIFNGQGACAGAASASAASAEPVYGAAQTGPEEVPVDLDIVKFQVPQSAKTGETIKTIRMTVKSENGPAEHGKPATLIGVQDGKEVYNETRTVFDYGAGQARFAFPSHTPIKKGTIVWTVQIFDENPDNDEATATTSVK